MTGTDPVNLGWSNPHQECIIISTGTTVIWSGTFFTGNGPTHPLNGGVTPTTDNSSPITMATEGGPGPSTTNVTFSQAGDYPYHCGIHTSTMKGVIYVQ